MIITSVIKGSVIKGAMRCLQAKPYKYQCSSCQAVVTANRLFHVLDKDYFMLHKILCGFITVHSPFNMIFIHSISPYCVL